MIGQTLGHYQVVEKLGEGGMGEVYKALDTKLGREVAIKVLPEAFAENKERLARFEREARLLASLNHPNIATLFDLQEHDGTHFLVLELVPGETLAERIKKGPIPVDEALPLFKQIAEGLEAAHEKGIIHRDLKPANIKVAPEGKAKVLDFGLAKALAEEPVSQDLSESPTITRACTETGVLLGTAPYMSPEQARGKAVDKRTDIWAFGCCLYEALTGKAAFQGETVTDTLARIVEREPNFEALMGRVPPSIHRLLRRCLQRDPNLRLHDVADARIEIQSAMEEAHGTSAPPMSTVRGSRALAVVTSIAVIAVVVATWSLLRPPEAPPVPITRSTIQIGPGLELPVFDFISTIAVSPDGRYVAYVARRTQSPSRLYLRAMEDLNSRVIEESTRTTPGLPTFAGVAAEESGAAMPFFSPDSQWLGFWANGKLMKVAISGGAPISIADMPAARGASWGADDSIVFSPSLNSGLWRISADGGEPEVLTVPDRARREKAHRYPDVLPGGKAVLFTVGTGEITSWDDASIALLSLETGEQRVLIEGGTFARYIATGHIIYGRGGDLLAIPFDLNALEVKGSPVPAIRGVSMTSGAGNTEFGVSRTGTLLYASGGSEPRDRLYWVSRNGLIEPLIDTPRPYISAKPSPDGRSLAIWIEEANGTVLIHDIERGTWNRLITGFDNHYPVWSPDGQRLAFASNRDGPPNIYSQAADGSDKAERLTTSANRQSPMSWSPDGTALALNEIDPQTGYDIWVFPIDGRKGPELFLQTEFNESIPQFSPDGLWIAYQSDESGQDEIYIRPFPGPGRKWQISIGGGRLPMWNPRGEELFYRNGDQMLAVDIDTQRSVSIGKPRVLFDIPSGFISSVMPDGNRFVSVAPGESVPKPIELVLVQNWGEELKRLVPTN